MDQKQIDSFLFKEMPDTEREKIENDMLASDELFFEIAERENELVDRYLRRDLPAGETERLERAVSSNTHLREKISNARVFHEFIADENRENKTITIAERRGFFAKFFSFGPQLQFAAAGAVLILALVSIFLLLENRRLSSLEGELAAARQRESELIAQTDNEREISGDLAADLSAEREKITRLEAELAKHPDTNTNKTPSVSSPTIATLLLSPVGIRGGSAPAKRFDLARNIDRVTIVVELPDSERDGERVAVKLNGKAAGSNLRVRKSRINVTLPATRLDEGRNRLEVTTGSETIAAHDFSVNKVE